MTLGLGCHNTLIFLKRRIDWEYSNLSKDISGLFKTTKNNKQKPALPTSALNLNFEVAQPVAWYDLSYERLFQCGLNFK